MVTLVIPDVDETTMAVLTAQAAQNGRSLDDEVCSILKEVLAGPAATTIPNDQVASSATS